MLGTAISVWNLLLYLNLLFLTWYFPIVREVAAVTIPMVVAEKTGGQRV